MQFNSKCTINVIEKNVPEDLKDFDQWIGFNYELDKNGKPVVYPRNILDNSKALMTNPDTWTDFETCIKNAYKFDGIAFVVCKNDPFVVWEIKKCCDREEGEIHRRARTFMYRMESYAEYSFDGTGINILVKGRIGPFGRKSRINLMEVYDHGRFTPITGQHIPCSPKLIRERINRCADLHEEYFYMQIRNALRKPENVKKWEDYKSNLKKDDEEIWPPF